MGLHGLKWLTLKEAEWLMSLESIVETEMNFDKLELKRSIVVNATAEKSLTGNDLTSRYSLFSRLIRISAFCLRIISNCKVKAELRKTDYISASEFEQATLVLEKHVKLTEFPNKKP
ncbi:hypothetical protein NPIL_197231 [Nephila pilipes]|uniref:Uncharacterized protein n=1 Tax=Nephila pilipes TaxID=299642 RepID=A0A8X6PML3_NEPPI|nr:hypothetical protein NPIL_197231 [Nephila pilipes]